MVKHGVPLEVYGVREIGAQRVPRKLRAEETLESVKSTKLRQAWLSWFLHVDEIWGRPFGPGCTGGSAPRTTPRPRCLLRQARGRFWEARSFGDIANPRLKPGAGKSAKPP